MPKRGIREYASQDIVVGFEPARCIHAANCVRELPAVFDVDRKPWIDPEGASADAIADQIARCPTGALTARTPNGDPIDRVESGFSVAEVPNGPLYVRGDFTLVDDDGEAFPAGTRAALCRCGASANKPYCDGSHTDAGFTT